MKKVFLFLFNIFFSPLWAGEFPKPFILVFEKRLTNKDLIEKNSTNPLVLVHVLQNMTSESFTIHLVKNEKLTVAPQKEYYIYSCNFKLFSKLNLKKIKSSVGEHTTHTQYYSTNPQDWHLLLNQKIKKNQKISHYQTTSIREPSTESTHCCFEHPLCLISKKVEHSKEECYQIDPELIGAIASEKISEV